MLNQFQLDKSSLFHQVARVIFVGLATAAALSVSACGGGGGGGSAEVLRNPPQKPSYGVDEGENAKMETIGQTNVAQTYFEKRYNRPNLEGVLRASSTESVKYIHALTVNPYRVVTTKAVPYFLMLPVALPDLISIWDSAAGRGSNGGSLAGLYFEACGYIKCTTSDPLPTILVASESTRWTIIHEMMHHLFNVQRKKDGTLSNPNALNRLDQSAKRAQTAVDQYREFNDRSYLTDAANEFETTLKWTKLALATHQLEEATVERVLVDDWLANRLVYVDSESPVNALWYMGTNAKEAISFDGELRSALTSVLQLTVDASATDAHDHIAALITNLDAYNDGIKKTVLDAVDGVKAKLGITDDGTDTNSGTNSWTKSGSSPGMSSGRSSLISNSFDAVSTHFTRADSCLGDDAQMNKIRAHIRAIVNH